MAEFDDEVRAAACMLAEGLVPFWQDRLGAGLLGFYLLGSLAHGGFSRRYSDFDVGLVSEDGIDEAAIAAMRDHARTLSPGLAPRLSLFWTDRRFALGRFPPLDRADLLDHGVPLIERERVRPDRPTLAEVRGYLAGAPFERWSQAAARFAALDALEPDAHKPYLRAHLYPARLVYSFATGRMASNDDAVAFLRENRPDGLDMDLVERALRIRREAADPDPLFADRAALPRQVASCARLLGGA